MLTKSLFMATFLALAQFTLAIPPGCLLGAVNSYSDPSNVKAVCQQKDLSSNVAKFCGDNTQAAMAALADVCNDQGVKVATNVPTSTSGSSKPSGTGSYVISATGGSGNATVTMTGSNKPSGSGYAGASATTTGGLAQATGAAGRVQMGVAAVMAGLMAAAL